MSLGVYTVYEVLYNLVQGLWRNGFGQTDGRTNEAVTVCLLFGEHDKQYNYCNKKKKKKKKYSLKNCNFTRKPAPFFCPA